MRIIDIDPKPKKKKYRARIHKKRYRTYAGAIHEQKKTKIFFTGEVSFYLTSPLMGDPKIR
ncbi:MAG: hypothetical protein CO150_01370 [Nitrospirae bacterium CG_4_9_14_3_um_filter_53_35]|nr:MAG: hypothetical protein COZ95_04270 [Nitrospirae bacterium CG_4_8_14_3_um_filter_50_41]PJA77346.1 MAG: hypothetical protein CO150_01370 [Nitrospirae bacterium CG_4_9_14_3_um_filter_53_35]